MGDDSNYIGQRLSLNSQALTVRYVGQVEGKPGDWLGVEWDDQHRGKHDGSFEGRSYFKCRSDSLHAASFIRPRQEWDKPRTFLEALSDRYFRTEDARSDEIVYVSRTKPIEEVGFDKFARRQAELRGIHVLVLERMQIRHLQGSTDGQAITSICRDITDLDIGGNLFETFDEVLALCEHFPKLKRLTLGGNRLRSTSNETHRTFEGVRTINLSETLLTTPELADCLSAFPNVEDIELAANGFSACDPERWPQSVKSLDLSRNHFDKIRELQRVLQLPQLVSVNLQHNRISECTLDSDPPAREVVSSTLQSLDVRHNEIGTWRILDNLDQQFPALRHLCVSGNPLYSHLVAANGRPLSAADGYMLTIARLPRLQSLNYSTISDQLRLNSEKYYLDSIASELLRIPESAEDMVINQHPRWKTLCDEYGTPLIDRTNAKGAVNLNSLAGRLVEIKFYVVHDSLPHLQQRSWTQDVPKAFNVYALHGIVARQLDVLPLSLQLFWETDELDPIGDTLSGNVDGWDSSDEEGGIEWSRRDVELTPSTRPLGAYIEQQSAKIRVELHADHQVAAS